MYQVPLATSSSCISEAKFWNTVAIYHNRPHLVNRKIAAVDQILFYRVDFEADNVNDITDVLSCHALTYEIQKLKDLKKDSITESLLMNLLDTYDKNVKIYENSIESLFKEDEGVFLSVRIILPRMKNAGKCVELVVLDLNKRLVTFFFGCQDKSKVVPLPAFTYRIELTKDGFMRITLNNFEDADTNSAEWLADNLFSKLLKWADNPIENNNFGVKSLSKVPVGKYCNLYHELKVKYGEPLRKVWWDKTKTDPQKFIFEDIAIASYLICMWFEECTEARKHVKFVDCGCGNGLLVYILNQEGFTGYGIDIRRRNIWDLFLDNTDLREGIVGPDSTFPEATWLIGNHSDELTPWLPIVALKSSPETNFFVLPCCPFDFNGKKYIRLNTAVSQYADYLEYIKNMSELCDFDTYIDKLRIPSTKRTCIVGIRRNQDIGKTPAVIERIENFINTKFNKAIEFIPRSNVEKVRNCTQIDRGIIDKLVKNVVSILLSNKNFISKQDGTEWNRGETISLGELSKLLLNDDLNHLKNECGGLQTLLRNHRYLFKIETGKVCLREPFRSEDTLKYKDKPCWFYRFHPNGCLYNFEECAYSHMSAINEIK